VISQNGLIFIYFGGVTNLVIVSAITRMHGFFGIEEEGLVMGPFWI
jgi:hypothetical protein